jgi:hypothetical protein
MLQAAKAAHVPAQQRLAFYYEVGEGCSRDLQRADYWRNFATRVVESEISPAAEVEDSEALSASPAEPSENLQTEFSVDLGEVPDAAAGEIPTTEIEQLPEPEGDRDLDSELDAELDAMTDVEPEGEVEFPVLTPEEALLEAEEISGEESVELSEEPQLSNAEPERGVIAESQTFAQPTAAIEKRKGLASRFRSGLAGVLRRIADRVSGSSASND